MKERRIRLIWISFVMLSAILSPLLMLPNPCHFPYHLQDSNVIWAQGIRGEEKEQSDSHYIQMMKQFRTKVDAWLKDLNERIESEDVTRFEVRFLEILRSFLEWVREKIDAQIESGERKPKKRTGREDV